MRVDPQEFPFEESMAIMVYLGEGALEVAVSFNARGCYTFVPAKSVPEYLDRLTIQCKEKLRSLLGQNMEVLEENRDYIQKGNLPAHPTDRMVMLLLGAEWSDSDQRDYDALGSLYQML